MPNRFSVEAVFKAVDRISAPVSRMQNRVGKFTRASERGLRRVNERMKRFSQGAQRYAMVAAAGLAIVGGAMWDIIQTGARFEDALLASVAKFPEGIEKGTQAYLDLQNAARQVGRTTRFTATEAAQGLDFLAMAGFNAASAVEALPGVTDLAIAGQMDLARATDIASDSLGAFNLMSTDAATVGRNLARVNNVLAKTATSANTTIEQMFEAITQAGPVGTAAGASIETVSALIGQLAGSGIKASVAGTTLKNVFTRLTKESDKFAALGIQVRDANGNIRDVIDIFGDLEKRLAKMGTFERSKIIEQLFGLRAIAGANTLLSIGANKLRAYRTELVNSDNAAKNMAATMRQSVGARLKGLQSAVESVKLSIFAMNEGPLADTIDKMTQWVRANEGLIATRVGEWLAWVINNFEKIVTWLKRIGVVVAAIWALITALKVFAGIMTVVNVIMAANPVVLITLGVLALIAAIVLLIKNWEKVKAWLDTIPTWAVVLAGLIGGPIAMLIAGAELVRRNWKPLKTFFVNLWSGIVNVFNTSLEKIRSVIDRIRSIATPAMGIASRVAGFLGIGGGEVAGGAPTGQMVSPQERTARSIEERRETSTAEVTIRDETGRAEVTQGTLGAGLSLAATGAF